LEDIVEFEGTWEDVSRHSAELSGRRVRITVLPENRNGPPQAPIPVFRAASGRSLLRHAGSWSGNDLEACLRAVEETRAPLEF